MTEKQEDQWAKSWFVLNCSLGILANQIELESESGNGDSDREAGRSRATWAELGGAKNALD